jgi:hypothetical protein
MLDADELDQHDIMLDELPDSGLIAAVPLIIMCDIPSPGPSFPAQREMD